MAPPKGGTPPLPDRPRPGPAAPPSSRLGHTSFPRPPAKPGVAPRFPATGDLSSSLSGSGSDPTTGEKDKEEDLSPLCWDTCFDERRDVPVAERGGVWRVYTAGFPARGVAPATVLLLLHGAGHGALSWGLVARSLRRHVAVVAYDARGHGHTHSATSDPAWDEQLDTDTQVSDARALFGTLFPGDAAKAPQLVIAGHSMGGAIAVRLAACANAAGLVVLDVVEGTALSALPHMRQWLTGRTASFTSVQRAVRYVLRAGHVRNAESARLSVPAQLRRVGQTWQWRTPLEHTETFWRGWFQGLSPAFLAVNSPKVLILADVNRLDKDLMIAQMQGRFQNVVVAGAGHAVHEDRPEETAGAILDFLHRNLLVDQGVDADQEVGSIFQQRKPIVPLR